jgi:hypothetical protein
MESMSRAIHNLPARRDPQFTGRRAQLEELAVAAEFGRLTVLASALPGRRGVGATHAALEHAWRRAAEPGLVWWIRAHDPAILAADAAALSEVLDLPERRGPLPVVLDAVKGWLARSSRWLLILDGARAPAEADRVVPQRMRGQVLVVACDAASAAWKERGVPVTVGALDACEVAEMLSRGGLPAPAGAELDELVRLLAGLPSGVDLAAAYLRAAGIPIARLLEALTAAAVRGPDPAWLAEAIVRLLMRRLERESPAAAQLVRLCSYLGPGPLDSGLLAARPFHLPLALRRAARRPPAWRAAVECASRHRLLHPSSVASRVWMSPLVADLVRNTLARDDAVEACLGATAALHARLPEPSDDGPTRWMDRASWLAAARGLVLRLRSERAEWELSHALVEHMRRLQRAA